MQLMAGAVDTHSAPDGTTNTSRSRCHIYIFLPSFSSMYTSSLKISSNCWFSAEGKNALGVSGYSIQIVSGRLGQ
jgi:hypothetical protein